MIDRPHKNRLGELVGGKYRIVRFLAAGGMGVVYEAQHTVVKRRFAVKFLHAELATRRDILARFEREAGAAGALESENVTAAIDFGIVEDGTPYIVMEYLVGESLATLLGREQTLPAERAADLCLQACRGVQAAHAAGIVHRDLKPQNLFVCRRQDGTDLLKVLDFGVAKLEALDDDSVATRTGAVLGTVSYMSPEQARGDKVVDHRADIYSLGAILYEMLSGQRPHPGDSNNAVLYHISTQPAVPLESVRLGLPPALVETVARALSSDPQQRPPSAEAFGGLLASVARREVWPEAKVSPSSESSAPGEPARAVEKPSTRPAAPATRRRGLLIGAAVAVLAAAALAVGLGTTGGQQISPTPVAVTPAPAAPAAAPQPLPVALPTAASPALAGSPPVTLPAAERNAVHAAQPAHAVVRARARPAPARPVADPPAPPASAPEPPPAGAAHPAPVTFDQQNPYN